MSEIQPTYLEVRWTTSRGAETYGYNICTVEDQTTGKRFRCMGGGYDMLGTSFGEWLQETYQAELLAIKDQAYSRWVETDEGPWDREHRDSGLYGMSLNVRKGGERVSLDGACGISSIEMVAKAIGMELVRTWNRKGNTTGYIVSAAVPVS